MLLSTKFIICCKQYKTIDIDKTVSATKYTIEKHLIG